MFCMISLHRSSTRGGGHRSRFVPTMFHRHRHAVRPFRTGHRTWRHGVRPRGSRRLPGAPATTDL